MKVKLTDKAIRSAEVPAKGEKIIWDTDIPGLGLRVRSSGARSLILKRGKQRWTLGRADDRKIADVRAEALAILSDIASGKVPGRKPRAQKPRVSDLMSAYMKDHVSVRCSQSTQSDYQALIDIHILPTLGDKPVDEVVPRDVDLILNKMADTPSAANKVTALLKAAMQKGMRWGIRSPALGNPCQGALMHETRGKEEYLEREELAIVLQAMDEVGRKTGRKSAAACLKMLALTGCRRDEIRLLEWHWIDWDRNRIDWPNTKTGAGHLVLNSAAIGILDAIWKAGIHSGFVFTGMDKSIPLPRATLYRAWDEVKKVAATKGVDAKRLERLWLHDLRHSFATLGLSYGLTLDDVGRLLRHRDTRSTKRYARHLPSRELSLAAQTVEFLPDITS